MNNHSKRLNALYFSAILLIILITIVFYVASINLFKKTSLQFQKDPFYRSLEQLTLDGVKIVSLPKNIEETMHDDIQKYYTTAYRAKYREQIINGFSEEQGLEEWHTQKIELIDSAKAKIISYSQPRIYENLNNVVGIFALGGLYDESGMKLKKSSQLFLFTINGEMIYLEKALPVGEDNKTFESAPIESFKRGLAE